MRGHTRKRGDRWYYVIDVGHHEKGKRKQRWVSKTADGLAFTSRKAAQQALTDALSRLHQGNDVEPSRQTVGEYLTEWLEASRGRVKPTTISGYRQFVHHDIIPALGGIRLQGLTPAKLNAFYAALSERGLKPKSVRNCHVVIHKALADGVRWGRIVRNPADLADPPRVPRSEMRVWDLAQLRRFLAHVAEDRLYAAWIVAATTGVRRGELLGLRWSDVDLDGGRVRITQALVVVDGKPAISDPKTAKGRRQLALDPDTVAALMAHRVRQMQERLKWGETYVDSGLCFTREDGSPVSPEWFSDAFARHAAKARLPRVRLHDVRHSYATAALAAGVHPKIVSERLGHSSVGITLDRYSHVVTGMDELAAARVAGLILGS
jgi:integrase